MGADILILGDELEEEVLGNAHDRQIGGSTHRGSPGRIAKESKFAEQIVAPHGNNRLRAVRGLEHHIHLAFDDYIGCITDVALVENFGAGIKGKAF